MYRSCIFCSADLGANESIEAFPVGRSLAFDGEKGRLWAVCPKCARWNLAPIEERWEPIEEAERLFRGTRTRVQRENVGLAKLRDGTRLIRVGAAVAGELAVWRYGESLARRRRRRFLLSSVPATAGGAALGMSGALAATMGAGTVYAALLLLSAGTEYVQGSKVIYTAPGADPAGGPVRVRRRHLVQARLGHGDGGVELHLPALSHEARGRRFSRLFAEPLVLRGLDAQMALGRAMAVVNAPRGTRRELDAALRAIQAAGSPGEMLLSAGRNRLYLTGARTRTGLVDTFRRMRQPDFWNGPLDGYRGGGGSQPKPALSLAVEMALHEEMERRALEGELSALEEMWKQAEEIAAIADRLPDDVPASAPPRLT